VDIFGNDVPDFERDIPEIDGPESWPASIEIDAIHYEISDPREAARLEALAREAEIDRHDAPTPGEAKWITLMWSGSLPPAATPTDDELGQLAAFGCI
jgi:hypothetical protein